MYSEKPRLHIRQSNYVPGTLRTLAIDVTPKCNMKCSHCYADTFVNVKALEFKYVKRLLDEAYDMGVFHYVLQGGEPIEDLERLEFILKNCYPLDTFINVVSNGWKMSKERINWLKDLHVDKIAFSLDSGIREEHDSRRAIGSYDRVLKAIDDVLDFGLLTSISIVVTHQSLHSEGFKRAYEFAEQKNIKIDVQIAEPVGKWDGLTDVLMTEEDSLYIKQLQEESPILPFGQRMVNRDIFCGEEDHCPAGVDFMSVSADGQVLPCNFLHFSLGNIKDKSLSEMRTMLLTSPWFDGKHENCLCGENQEFIQKYIVPHINKKKPLDAKSIFNLEGD